MARGTLGELQKKLTAALPRIRDERTRMHVQDCLREVELLLGNRSGERLGGPA